MHDLRYREAAAWQNVYYNQPPHQSYFMGDAPSPPLFFRGELKGDYNFDGVVDAGDNSIWRDALDTEGYVPADGDHNRVVDQGDYQLRRQNYGAVAAMPTMAVPADAAQGTVINWGGSPSSVTDSVDGSVYKAAFASLASDHSDKDDAAVVDGPVAAVFSNHTRLLYLNKRQKPTAPQAAESDGSLQAVADDREHFFADPFASLEAPDDFGRLM